MTLQNYGLKELRRYVCFVTLVFFACTNTSCATKSAQTISQDKFLPDGDVRVGIIHTLDTISVSFISEWQAYMNGKETNIYNAGSRLNICVMQNQLALISENSNLMQTADSVIFLARHPAGELMIKQVPYGIGWWWAGAEDRRYEGKVSVYVSDKGKPEVIITLSLEDYLCGVVPYEIGTDAPLAALKAQAVAARSEAVMALKSDLYSGKHHDVTSDVKCQVFSGNNKRSSASDRAVKETSGIIITNQGKPVHAYYASNCGGHSELITNVWPERPASEPYLAGLSDQVSRKDLDLRSEEKARDWINNEPATYCNPFLESKLPSWSRKNFRWKRTFSADSLSNKQNSKGRLKDIIMLKRGVSGRCYQARFIFADDTVDIHGELAIRQMWQPALRSSCFYVEKQDDQFTLHGAGWGHGVGMCQSGAVAMALNGHNFKSILAHYYPQTELTSIY